MNDCHPDVEQMKADYLDFLYATSGRNEPGHPLNNLYTGLWLEHQRECAEAARLAWWEFQRGDTEAFDQ